MKKNSWMFIIIMLMCVSCSKNSSMNETESNSTSETVDVNGVAIVTKDSLELSFDDFNCTYYSYGAEESNGSGFSHREVRDIVKQRWIEECENENLFPRSLTSITLQFRDIIPKSLHWTQYYLDKDGDFHSFLNSEIYEAKIENLETTLPIGIGATTLPLHSSEVSNETLYRIIYLECDFEEEVQSYIIVFDAPEINNIN